jgi:hypothetical protein
MEKDKSDFAPDSEQEEEEEVWDKCILSDS